MRKVKVALVGAGVWGQVHAQVYGTNPVADFVAVCDANIERARKVAQEWGASEVFASVDELIEKADFEAVGVATPDFAHKEIVLKLARAGKKILVEKPLATSVEDCEVMIEAVESNPEAALMVDFHCRWVLPFVAVKHAITAGELGDPVHAFARLSDTLFVPRKMLSWAAKSNPAWFLAVHCVDLLRWFFEEEIVKVYSVSQRRVLRREGINCEDYFQSILEFASGRTAIVENSWLLPERSAPALFDFRVEVVGDKGAMFANLPFSDAVRKYTDAPKAAPYYPSVDVFFGPQFDRDFRGGAHAAINTFITCVSEGRKMPVDGIDGLRATQVVQAMHKSVEKGTPVTLNY